MSPRPIARNHVIKRLIDEGYEVELPGNGYMLVRSIPYVTSQRTVAYGTVITNLHSNLDEVLPPPDHQVWFVGDFPCHQDGTLIEGLRHSSGPFPLWDGCQAQHRFSNKPATGSYSDYYEKMTRYIAIISNEAKAIDPNVTPCTFKLIEPAEDDSVFNYDDTASSRADILAITAKLAMRKVAIIGLGGTGSYVLDFLAKTPIGEIHLFDGDSFLQHNAFRSPGAATEEELEKKLPKVEYHAQAYSPMRKGIVPHPEFITDSNVEVLAGFDFAFMCVDKGPVRRLISGFLQGRGIPFIDVGMSLLVNPDDLSLVGTCRATMSTPVQNDHIRVNVPMADDLDEDLYRKNIQVADMNALNAALAVIQWKQFLGFYQDQFKAHHLTYSVNIQLLTRGVMPGMAPE